MCRGRPVTDNLNAPGPLFPAALPEKAVRLTVTNPGTGAAACSIAREVYRVARLGKLDHHIGIAVGGSVARAMTGISRAARSVTGGTGDKT